MFSNSRLAPRLGPLTDRRIDHYVRLGFYGVEKQQALKNLEHPPKKPKKEKRSPSPSLLSRALALLDV